MLQESSSSHNIPHVALPAADGKHHLNYPLQMISYSVSNSSDLCVASPTHSASTPQLKKKLTTDSCTKRESVGSVSKHQSFDYASSKFFDYPETVLLQ